MIKKIIKWFSGEYRVTFSVVYQESTGRILEERWYIQYRDLPFFPWVTISPDFKDYDEAMEWAKTEHDVEPSYYHYGKEEPK